MIAWPSSCSCFASGRTVGAATSQTTSSTSLRRPGLPVLDGSTFPCEIESSPAIMVDLKTHEQIDLEKKRHDVSTSLNYYPVDAGPPIPVMVGK